jgi:hypothetical protein
MCPSAMTEVERRSDELPSRGVRAFVVVFLSAFLLCGLFGFELWPLTGWRLFSELRTDRQVTWRATVVAEDGETQIAFAELPRAYRNFPLVMRTFSSLPPAEQAAACRAWLGAARREHPRASAVRIYRVDWYLSHRHGSREGPPPRSTLLLACDLHEVADATR